MKKKQLIKALVFSAVLAAFPAAGLTASAEDAAPADVLDVAPAPVAVAADVQNFDGGGKSYDFEGAATVGEAVDKLVPSVGDEASDNVKSAAAAAAVDAAQKVADAAGDGEKAAEDKAVELITGEAAGAVADDANEAAGEAIEKAEGEATEDETKPVDEAPVEAAPVKQNITIIEGEEDFIYPHDFDTYTEASVDKDVIKAGTTAKVKVDKLESAFDIVGYDKNGKPITLDFSTATRFFSSDNSIATVDPDGTIHALKEGKVTIWVETSEGLNPVTLDISESYNVLLIDKSESTKGKGLAKEKAAAISFADEVLKVNKESHVAVIEMGSETTTKTLSGWTSNLTDIKNIINGIKAEGGSVYSAAIKQAGALLNTIPYYKQGYNKNIVMFADGEDTNGDRAYAKDCLHELLYDTEIELDYDTIVTEAFTNKVTGKTEYCPVYFDDNGDKFFGVLTDKKDADGNFITEYYNAETGLLADATVTALYPIYDVIETEYRDTTTNFYAFGVYDSSTEAGKKDGSGFLKDLAKNPVTAERIVVDGDGHTFEYGFYDDMTRYEDNYYEVTSVKDMQQTFKNIANKKVYSKDAWVDSLLGFDIYVYGKASSSSDDTKAAKAKSDKKTDSPSTGDCSGIYTIALFALLGAGAAAFTAKKRFED
jgi:hypothetical protein